MFSLLVFLSPIQALSQPGGIDVSFPQNQFLSNGAAAVLYVAVQTANGYVVAGDFTTVNGVPRGGIARFTSSGDLDLNFASGLGANGAIYSVVVQSNGGFLIGGDFTTFDGEPRGRFARLTASGAVDLSFDPGLGLNGPVYAIAVRQGSVFVGGNFSTADGVSRNSIAMFEEQSGTHQTSFNPGQGLNGIAYAITVDSNSWSSGSIYLGGQFSSYDGVSRNNICRIHTWGSLDSQFNVGSGFDGPLFSITIERFTGFGSSGSGLLVGGDFNSFDGIIRAKLARLSADNWISGTRLDPTFKLALNGAVRSITVATTNFSGGRFYIAGDFDSVDGAPFSRMARVTATSTSSFPSWSSTLVATVDAGFTQNTLLSGSIKSAVALSDTRVLLAGSGLLGSGSLVRLYGDYGTSVPLNPSALRAQTLGATQIFLEWVSGSNTFNYRVESSLNGGSDWNVAVTSGTSYVATGLSPGQTYQFRVQGTNYNGPSEYTATIAARTMEEEWTGPGSLDASVVMPNSTVHTMIKQPDGKIVISGSFTSIAGTPINRVARLNADMSLDTSFNVGAGANSTVNSAALQADGKIVIVGSFTQVDAVNRSRIARLNANGSLDNSFDVGLGPDSTVEAVAVQSDGKIVVGGSFSNFDGLSQNRVARINANGSLDLVFRTTANSTVNDIHLLGDGRFYLVGSFSTVNGSARRGVVRMLSDGSVDPSFDPRTGGTTVRRILVIPSGSILLAGSFSNFAGSLSRNIVKLSSDGQVEGAFGVSDAPSSSVESLALDEVGRVLIGGGFTKVGNAYQPRMARLLADGSLDPSFVVGIGPSSTVNTILVQEGARILCGGSFSSFNGSSQRHLARILGGDTATPLILTDALPHAVSGEAYTAAIRAVGGSLPYTWSVVNGRLPSGLNFSAGTVEGVSTENITTEFTVKIVDANAAVAERTVRLTSQERPVGLRILSASYGASSTFVDVTSFVEAFVNNSLATINVSNSALGGDPIFGQVKTLWVTYQNSSGKFVVSAREGTVLSLPSPAATRLALNFDEWRSTKFSSLQLNDQSISGPHADPDGDGVPNILESVVGGDPLDPDPQKATPVVNVSSNNVEVRIIVDAYQADATYSVQVSSTLTNPHSWITIARSVSGQRTETMVENATVDDIGIGVREVTIVHEQPSLVGSSFYRVLVQRP